MVTKRFITVSASANVDDTGRGTGETNLAFHFLDIQKKKKSIFQCRNSLGDKLSSGFIVNIL